MKTHSAASTILTMIAQPYPTSVSTTMCLILEEISGIERERVIFFQMDQSLCSREDEERN